MRWVLGFIIALSILLFSASGQAQCPEGYKCLPDEEADKVAQIVENHNCMVRTARNGDIVVSGKPYRITITKDGQVFTDELMAFSLDWCAWDLDLYAKPKVAITRHEENESDWGFRLRVRLGVMWLPTYALKDDTDVFRESLDSVLLLEPFHYKSLHLVSHLGLKSFGLGVGLDLTRNLNVVTGVGLDWNADVVPVVGFSLSFN